MKLQEYCQITWVTVGTFYHYIFVATAIIFICLHMLEQSCIHILGVHSSIITFLCLRLNKGLHKEIKGTSRCRDTWNSFHQENRTVFIRTTLDASLLYRKVCWVCSCVLPRSLWTRTWRSAFPGSFSAASSGLSWSAPGSPVSLCVLTDSAWMWPVWQVSGRAVWIYLGGIWRQTWGQSDNLWVFELAGDAVWSHTHIHVFNIHLCLLLQLNNHLFVKLLELSEEKKKIQTKQNQAKIYCTLLILQRTAESQGFVQ